MTCSTCGRRFTGSSPVGYRDDQPVCDLCLLEASADLGMVLALVSVARSYAGIAFRTGGKAPEALDQLELFARVYELIAVKTGPRRNFLVPGFTDDDPVDR